MTKILLMVALLLACFVAVALSEPTEAAKQLEPTGAEHRFDTREHQKFCMVKSHLLNNDQIKASSSRFKSLVTGGKETPLEDVQKIYQMLKDTTDLCDKNGVTYWAEGGTLLGAIRDKGLIKWDDDGDIGIPIEQEDGFVALKPKFKALGYDVYKWYYGYKVSYTTGRPIPDAACKGGVKPFKYPFLDIFMVDFQDDDRTYYPRSNLWPNCYFYRKDLYDLKSCTFGPLTLKCARNPVPYLDTCYTKKDGVDWRTSGYQGKDHVTYANENEAPKPFSISGTNAVLPPQPLVQNV